MRFELSIALRYLKARRKQAFLSVVSFIAVLGFVLGVMALIVALALMTGFQEDIQSKILGASAHIMVYSANSRGLNDWHNTMNVVSSDPSVLSVSPVVYGKVMIYSSAGANGIIVKGIDPGQEGKVTELAAKIDRKVLSELKNPGQERDGIVLGADLAASLRVHRGDLVTLVSPDSMLSPLGMMPKFKKFRVLGEFNSGLYEYDTSWALVGMQTAQRLFSLSNAVSLIEARINDIYRAEEIANRLQKTLGNRFVVNNWIRQNQSLFSAMKLEKIMLFITIGLIVLVASFNVISTLVMMVLDKTSDIAILMAMGCTSRQIMRIFMLQGILIGVAGTIVGALLGVVGSWVMDHYRVIQLPLDVYFIPYLPFRVRPVDFVLITVTAVAISFVSTLYPALRASRINPAEALRYE
ncbi:lipoprotein-releasing ABC transporter permease subunit [bacterium]|nr:lipoprotein-releasing ABC transporter permease subunit [bacterium]MCI0604119.1 lipoprotein-releasing ABC transporter permease subunit [bacterium]